MIQPIHSSSTRAPTLVALNRRAELLHRLREFFWQRDFVEVETPLVSDEIIPELHIEPLRVEGGGYLQASPEMHMKRLLAAGMGNIFQVTRSFRAGERGPLHNPEFTIVEWYRVGDDLAAGMDLLDALMQSLLGTPPATRTTYADAFRKHLGACPFTATNVELQERARSPDCDDRDELLNLLLATEIESQLGVGRPEIIFHYPASQASLATIIHDAAGHRVAERFELYYRGVELANGFHELTDAPEQRRRFETVNAERASHGRPVLPMPERLLAAMDVPGLPPCTGCALGFDRLAMVAAGEVSIDAAMTISTPGDIM